MGLWNGVWELFEAGVVIGMHLVKLVDLDDVVFGTPFAVSGCTERAISAGFIANDLSDAPGIVNDQLSRKESRGEILLETRERSAEWPEGPRVWIQVEGEKSLMVSMLFDSGQNAFCSEVLL